MEINFEVLDKMILDLIQTDIITIKAKEELSNFVKTHDVNSTLSEETCNEMFGIYKLTLKPAYEAVTNQFLPNIFIRGIM